MNNLLLITYFKNKFKLLELFVNYYIEFWSVGYLVLCMGYTDEKYVKKILNRIIAIDGIEFNGSESSKSNPSNYIDGVRFHNFADKVKKYKLTILTYKTSKHISRKVFDKIIKTALCKISNNYVSDKYKNVMVVDNDEYYYSNNINKILAAKSGVFHFLEFIPQKNFNLESDFKFSLEPWFYIKDFVNYNTCELCKKIVFNRAIMQKPNFTVKMLHRHNCDQNDGVVCSKYQDSIDVKKLLFENNFCFHLSILDQKYLYDNKVKQGFNDSILSQVNENYSEIFDKKNNFKIIKLNFLKKFIKNNGK